ncbi:MAG: hypothetical protein ACYCO9_14285 [Streptosporangiaceae bacterium]
MTAVGKDDVDALVTSVAGLFAEDAGRPDPLMNLGWPALKGAAWARERGAQHASVTAYAANDAAQTFHARHGFAPQSVILRADL